MTKTKARKFAMTYLDNPNSKKFHKYDVGTLYINEYLHCNEYLNYNDYNYDIKKTFKKGAFQIKRFWEAAF